MTKPVIVLLCLFIIALTIVTILIAIYIDKKRTQYPTEEIAKIHLAHMSIATALTRQVVITNNQQVPVEAKANTKTVYKIMLRNENATENVNLLLGGRSVDDTPHRVTVNNLGSDWTTRIIDNSAADQFWNTYFPLHHDVRVAYYDIDPCFGAARADILRLALLYLSLIHI